MAGSLLGGAAGGGFRVLDEAARPPPTHPDYLVWEACASYIPRWALPYMRNCVANARAAVDGSSSPENVPEARFLMCLP